MFEFAGEIGIINLWVCVIYVQMKFCEKGVTKLTMGGEYVLEMQLKMKNSKKTFLQLS